MSTVIVTFFPFSYFLLKLSLRCYELDIVSFRQPTMNYFHTAVGWIIFENKNDYILKYLGKQVNMINMLYRLFSKNPPNWFTFAFTSIRMISFLQRLVIFTKIVFRKIFPKRLICYNWNGYLFGVDSFIFVYSVFLKKSKSFSWATDTLVMLVLDLYHLLSFVSWLLIWHTQVYSKPFCQQVLMS